MSAEPPGVIECGLTSTPIAVGSCWTTSVRTTPLWLAKWVLSPGKLSS